jgi:hypothetical protein
MQRVEEKTDSGLKREREPRGDQKDDEIPTKKARAEKSTEQDREALEILIIDFDTNSDACFDKLDNLLDKTQDVIFETMCGFQSAVIAVIVSDEVRSRGMPMLEKMLTILRKQYPDDNEYVEKLIQLIGLHFKEKDYFKMHSFESEYFSRLWKEIYATENYMHYDFITRVLEFSSQSNPRVARVLSGFFILLPGMEEAKAAVQHLIAHHLHDFEQTKKIVSFLYEADVLDDLYMEEHFDLLECYLLYFLNHTEPGTEEPIQILRMMYARPHCIDEPREILTKEKEFLSVYEVVKRHRSRLPQFFGDLHLEALVRPSVQSQGMFAVATQLFVPLQFMHAERPQENGELLGLASSLLAGTRL